jgi:hypothetical protein
MSRDPTLCKQFVKAAKEMLATHLEIKHTWSVDEDEDHCILDIPKQNNDGFDITVEVSPAEILIGAGSAHTEFYLKKDHEELIQSALGLVRDLLSPHMRIRERLAADKPYSWNIESLKDGKWILEENCHLIFWNYFGKRSEKIYQNSIVKGRLDNV